MAKEDVVAAIKAANAAIGAMVKTRDAKGIAARYTKTAKLLPPNMPVQKGYPAIGRFWQTMLDMGISGLALRTGEVDVHGTTANEFGTYTLKDAKGTKLDSGKYIVIWKKEGGAWKLHWDMFSSNNPA